MIKTRRRDILDKLMRNSACNTDSKIEERIESVFDRMADIQQENLDKFFEKVEVDIKQVKNQLFTVKDQV